MTRIPIFFSVNVSYVPYLGVTIKSLLCNASKDYFYEIIVLHNELDFYNISRIEGLSDEKSSIKCIDVSEYLTDKDYYSGPIASTKHISKETFYRLLIPEMYPNEKKIIYLDCDIVVLGDISVLYNYDMNNKTIAAVYSVEHWSKERVPVVPNNDKHEWFNAGVMVIDIQKYIANNYIEICKEEMKKTIFNVVDQDLLRLVCYKDTCYLPYEWNVMWHHCHNGGNGLKEHNKDLYSQIKKRPMIVHYTSGLKPWKMPGKELSEYFWKYARQTMFYEEIIYTNVTNKVNTDNENVNFEEYIFPFDKINKHSNVILYGAGKVGKIFKGQIEKTGWCKIVAWSDKKYKDDDKKKLELIPPDIISRLEYDYVLIAIEKKSIAEEIQSDLYGFGVDASKIVWDNYAK